MRRVVISCTLLTASLLGQAVLASAQTSPADAKTAVETVTNRFTPNPLVFLPGSKTSLLSTGSWGVQLQIPQPEAPPACQTGAESCVKVIYRVPQQGIVCSWIVGFPNSPTPQENAQAEPGPHAEILDEDANAAQFTMKKAWLGGEAPPLPSRQFLPAYPPIANAAMVGGDVIMQIVVDSSGKVGNTVVVSGPAMLQLAAKDAAVKWIFHPQLIGNKPTSFQRNLTFHFMPTGVGGRVTSLDVIKGVETSVYAAPNMNPPSFSRAEGP
jgi:TonB family protein